LFTELVAAAAETAVASGKSSERLEAWNRMLKPRK